MSTVSAISRSVPRIRKGHDVAHAGRRGTHGTVVATFTIYAADIPDWFPMDTPEDAAAIMAVVAWDDRRRLALEYASQLTRLS